MDTAKDRLVKRVLVITNYYPPASVGGYERKCERVVNALRETSDVVVLTSRAGARKAPKQAHVHRLLPMCDPRRRFLPIAPTQALVGSLHVKRILKQVAPDLVYIWNYAGLPHVTLGPILDSSAVVVFSFGDQWMNRLYEREGDLFTGFATAPATVRWESWTRRAFRVWARTFRLDLDPPLRRPVSVSWVSDYLRTVTEVPPYFEVVHDEVHLPFSPHAELLQSLVRRPSGLPTIVFVGRVTHDKGVDIAVHAVRALRQDWPEAQLLVAGPIDPHYRDQLSSTLIECEANSWVSLLGALDGEEVARLLAVADVGVIPSRWNEPGGLVALDMALARVPIVSALVGGLSELVRAPEARFFERDNVRACTAMIAGALRDRSETAVMVANASVRADQLSEARYIHDVRSFLDRAAEVEDGSY